MNSLLGSLFLWATLAAAAYGAVVSVVGARKGNPGLVAAGRAAAFVAAAMATLAILVMWRSLLIHDFSVDYVAQVGSRSTPPFISIISLWAALEGSILFWLWVLTLYTAVVAWLYRKKDQEELPYVLAVLFGIALFFVGVAVGPGNPFALADPIPMDGPGPNPLLQNHPLMAFHPPAQYLGYVGLSVPFAFALAALITGRVDSWWLKATRRWTLVAWCFLTLAIVAGGWWAYEVLGWGGYWAWDPVENAALMPWLVSTAFLHTIMVQERREMLRGWNVSLIVAAFALTILGTFLTRSGVLGSVHAFTQSIMGPLFLAFLGLVLIVSISLILWRSSLLRTPGSLDAVLSKEAAFLVSNLLLVAVTFTVLLGTVFPLVAEAARGVKVSVGAPYFNAMTVPVLAALLFMMGVGPALPWRKPPPEGVLREFGVPVAAGMVAAVIAALLGVRKPWPLLTMGLAGFASSVMALQMGRGTLARIRGGMGPVRAFTSLVAANRRRYGGYIVHFGVVLVAVGLAASWNYKAETEATLRPGDVVSVAGYDVRFDGVRTNQDPHRVSIIGGVTVARKGRPVGTLEPRMNYYDGRPQPIPTPAVRSAFTEDLFLNLMAYEQDGSSATFKVIVTPLVAWLWLGAAVMALGSMVAVWPKRRGSRASATVSAPPHEETVPVLEEVLS